MSEPQILVLPELEEIIALQSESARESFFSSHRQLVTSALVEEVLLEVSRLLRIDLQRAREVVLTASWLADLLDSPDLSARCERMSANVEHFSGNYSEAQALYTAALECFRSQGDLLQVAITQSSALLNLGYLGDYDTVNEWAAQARATFEGLRDRPRLAALDNNEASILYRQDRWAEALERYTSAHRVLVELGQHQNAVVALRNIGVCQISLLQFEDALESYHLAREQCLDKGLARLIHEVDYNIAYLYYLRGEYTEAIRLFRDARERCEHENDEYHLALCDLDQGEMYLELNLVQEAMTLAKSAFARFDELEMPYESAKALTNYAIAAARQNKGFLALDLLEKAREVFVREDNRLWPSQIDLYRALVLSEEGRIFEARGLASGALLHLRSAGLSYQAATCTLLLAQLDLAAGDLDSARSRCQEASSWLDELELPALECKALYLLGQIEEASGNPRLAFDHYEQSRARLEHLRFHLRREDLRISFLDDKQKIYERLVALSFEAADPSSMFKYMEEAKSRSLNDFLSYRSTLPRTEEASSERASEVRRIRQELNWYYRQIDLKQFRDGKNQSDVARLQKEARQREDELLRSLARLQDAAGDLGLLRGETAATAQEVRACLGNHTSLVEYFIADDNVYAVLISQERFEVKAVTVAGRVRELHRLLKFQLSKLRHGEDQLGDRRQVTEKAIEAHLLELYEELVAPLRSQLDTSHVVFVPHGFLHHVPFHALFDGSDYLLDSYSISYAPSARVYAICTQRRVEPSLSSLVLGVADHNAPHISEEAKTVAAALPHSTLLLNDQATQQRLREEGASCRYLHLATHGLFRRDNPMFSAIQLGDSRLSLFDLYQLRLEAELVVLSGCGTGLHVVAGADELLGLTRGLFYAGARAALVTQWDVNDRSTASLMKDFYELLSTGRSAAEALAQAMRNLRREYPNPYYWAPFILVGAPD